MDSGSESDSESVESESDSESRFDEKEKISPAKKPTKRPRSLKKPPVDSSSDTTDKKKPRLARISVKCEKEVDDSPASPSTTSSKNSDIAKRSDTNELNDDSSVKPADGDSPKGRDFDLNEIRSELKGIDKAVKLANAEVVVPKTELVDVEVKSEVPCAPTVGSIDEKPVVEQLEEHAVKVEQQGEAEETVKQEVIPVEPAITSVDSAVGADIKEDIYEFKEPEPFEFQDVRRPIRVFDEMLERSPEKPSSVAKNTAAPSTPTRPTVEKKEISPQDDVKSRFRKTICKKIKESEKRKTIESKTEDVSAVVEVIDDNTPPPVLEVSPPLEPETLKQDDDDGVNDEPPVITPMHKTSPEPPCLLPVTETLSCPPSEHSPVLVREEPPRLSTEASSSDSESEERLVIANDEESTSSDVKLEVLPVRESSPLTTPVPIEALPPPPTIIPEERRDTKRSPLSEIRLKRVEERLRNVLNNPVNLEEDSQPVKVQGTSSFRPVAGPSKVAVVEQPIPEPENQEVERSEPEAAAPNNGGLRSLVCDEDIPGSPAPKDPSDDLPFQPAVASVVENTPPTTPPTTPESNASSPRE